jgi:FixJ family two-component response regulator
MALEILQSRAGIGLLITDVSMPLMGGVELAICGRKLNSALKLIFSSGYGEVDLEAAGLSEENTVVLQKPYLLTTLASHVRKMLAVADQKKSA